ncbi:MAG: pseudouridine synthase, partial [Planctomycetaceae bacterium]|nr:pseudouridine synthase [Planctomycetaceae bacterium]
RQGVSLAEATVQAKRVTVRSQHKQSTVLEMVLDEGRNREIRRMLASLGHKVQQLKRIAVGDLTLGNLLPGQWRKLSWEEIERLRQAATAAMGENRSPKPRTNAPKRMYGGRSRANRENFDVEAGRRPEGQGVRRRPKRPGKASSWRKRTR